MVEIIPATKLKIAAIASDDDRLLVCVRDPKGRLLFVTELTKYLRERSEDEGGMSAITD